MSFESRALRLALHLIGLLASRRSGVHEHAARARQASRPEAVEAMKLEATHKQQGEGYTQQSVKDNTHEWIIAYYAGSQIHAPSGYEQRHSELSSDRILSASGDQSCPFSSMILANSTICGVMCDMHFPRSFFLSVRCRHSDVRCEGHDAVRQLPHMQRIGRSAQLLRQFLDHFRDLARRAINHPLYLATTLCLF